MFGHLLVSGKGGGPHKLPVLAVTEVGSGQLARWVPRFDARNTVGGSNLPRRRGGAYMQFGAEGDR